MSGQGRIFCLSISEYNENLAQFSEQIISFNLYEVCRNLASVRQVAIICNGLFHAIHHRSNLAKVA